MHIHIEYSPGRHLQMPVHSINRTMMPYARIGSVSNCYRFYPETPSVQFGCGQIMGCKFHMVLMKENDLSIDDVKQSSNFGCCLGLVQR